jgi:hypothetical protein
VTVPYGNAGRRPPLRRMFGPVKAIVASADPWNRAGKGLAARVLARPRGSGPAPDDQQVWPAYVVRLIDDRERSGDVQHVARPRRGPEGLR